MPTRRTSGRPDEPSTSSDQMEVDDDVDPRIAYICSILLTENRDVRDKLCTSKSEIEQPVEPVVEQIQRVEHIVLNDCVESVLKDPKFAVQSDLAKPAEEPEKPSRPTQLEPIEVKIEETDVSVLPSAGGETNVERAAKREAHVLSRIGELRKNGLWSNSRLPKCVEPERNKTHWDYLLEEVKWMATDFRSETNTKRRIAKALAGQIAKQHRDKEIEVERAAERELREKKRMCAGVAKMVRDFWQGVDKVVDIRAKEILESRLRKARNKHLMFMIGQVDEMSNIVQERLVTTTDEEFVHDESESDDERTIANAEKSTRKEDVRDEVDKLQNEANVEMDDFLQTLPAEYLKMYGLTPEDLEEMKEMKEAEKTQNQSQEPLQNIDLVKLNSNDSEERQQELANIAEEALKFQPKGYTLETTQVKTPVPFLIRGQLREYQMVGLDWMVTLYEKNLNGILADEMGLGKTIQTISLLAHLACSESIWGPHLIVVPTSVILNWEMEFKKWCPALKIMTYFGTAKERAEKRKGWMKANCFHVCITSYKTVTQDIRAFKQRAWQYLILDEAQNIKNWKSQRWQALLNVRARRRLLLTGTPLQNSLMELWSLMHFLMPTIFSSHDDFKDWFSNPLTGMMEGVAEFNAPLIQRLHKVLRPFILRRLKKEVEKQLPEKTEHIVNCSLSKRQRYLYDDFMSRRSTKENLKSGNMMSVLNIVMQLRKCCNHPNLFEPRPVVAPFVVQKLRLDLPAYLFNVSDQNAEQKDVPDIFKLEHVGWQTRVTSKKPLIEEIETLDTIEEIRPPKTDGFRFNRTTFVGKSGGIREPVSEGIGSEEEARGSGVQTPRPTIGGFHQTMSASGARNGLDEKAAHSPPLKRPKLTGSSVRWADYIPEHVVQKTEASRRNQLEVVRRRFGHLRQPLVPNEVVALLREQIGDEMGVERKKDEMVKEVLVQYVELLADRFGMYVEPVLTDAWQCRPSSSGLPSYIRHNMHRLESDSRSLLLNTSSPLDTQLSISRSLQFPELRLIEYDCGKLQTLAVLLRQLYLYKHRCLIFTQMSKMLDVLQTFLSHHGYQYFRLDGTTGVEQRQAMMERFNADPKIFCFILSTRSGGVGVNLTGADTVIFYDSDWNPTMDAQAQDRCHRIGQTRNVSIYRLISERTIEENILKKAMQKRRLGELAIDEAGFTPEFFKQSDSIRDLFDGEGVEVQAPAAADEKEMETAMAKCEDEADVNAAKIAKAEARVDVAEFEERAMPASKLDGDEEADEKYLELIQQLKPIERFAINLLEAEYKPEFEEECKEAEAMIEQKREEWDKNLNNAEASAENAENHQNDDESLFNSDFYSGSLLDELMADNFDEIMPIWLPPSPPASDADFDLRMEDDTFDLLYEIDPMNETRLPQVTHDLRRPLAEKQKQNHQSIHDILSAKEKESVYDAVAKCLQMTPAEPAAASPAYTENSFSMDDSSQDAKMEPPDVQVPVQLPVVQQKAPKRRRNDNRAAQNRNGESGVKRATTPPAAFREEADYDGAEWNIVEDYALLQAVQLEFANLHLVERSHLEGMLLNWELVANAVNKQTRFYRSARQCSIRYQMFVRPKELGQLVASDPITKKTVKVDLSATELSHLRRSRMTTESQYNYDYGLLTDKKHMNRFKTVRQVAQRRQVQFWRGPRESRNLQSLAGGMPAKHETKMAEFEVKLGVVLDAEDVATLTDEQIAAIENNKKKLVASRHTRPSPKPEIRYHTLVLRPYTIPMSSEFPPLPARKDMRVAVPPLQAPSPAPSAAPTPLPSLGSGGIQLPPLAPLQPPQSQVQQVQQVQQSQQPMPIRQVGLDPQQQVQQPTLQRRAASGSNVQFIQQSVVSQGQSYMVVPSGSQSLQTVGQQMGAPGGEVQQGQVPQRVQYVQGGRGGYANTLVMPRGSRVVRPGNMQQRVYIAPDRQYGMPQVVPVRVMPSNQQQRMMPGGARRNQPAPGTVAAMVLPNRGGNGGVAQMRQIPRGGGSYTGQQRINVMVTAAPAMRPGVGPVGQNAGVRRQLVGRPLSQRVDSTTPTVAQVVVAPPTGLNPTGGPPVLHMQRSAPQVPQVPQVPQNVQPPPQSSSEVTSSSTTPPK